MLKILFYIKQKLADFKYSFYTGYSEKEAQNFKNYLWEFLKTDSKIFTEKEKDEARKMLINWRD